MGKKDEVIIYTNEQCPYCKQVKEKLDGSNIEYTTKLTNEHVEEWTEVVNNIGIGNVPCIYYKDTYFVPGRDFQQPEHLVNIINNFQKPTFSTEKLCYERIKNMNWHMANAFQRVDVILKALETKLNTEENEHESTS